MNKLFQNKSIILSYYIIICLYLNQISARFHKRLLELCQYSTRHYTSHAATT